MTVRELLKEMKEHGISEDAQIDIAFNVRSYDENGFFDDEWEEERRAEGVEFGPEIVCIYVNN